MLDIDLSPKDFPMLRHFQANARGEEHAAILPFNRLSTVIKPSAKLCKTRMDHNV
jgi:hypothetical protein